MNRSTKDEPTITPREFLILKEIVKRLPDQHARASLETATACYEEVLIERDIDIKSDKSYFSALLRLSHYEGATWHEKLLNAAAKIEEEFKSRAEIKTAGHRRYRSDTTEVSHFARHVRGKQSVLHQRLARESDPLRISHPPRLDLYQQSRELNEQQEIPALSEEVKYALVQKFKLFQRTSSRRKLHETLLHWYEATRIMQEIRHEQMEYAISQDNHVLKLQAFEIWLRNHEMSQQSRLILEQQADAMVMHKFYSRWENLTIERHQEQYLARLAAEKQALFEAVLTKNQKKMLLRKLKVWRRSTKKIRLNTSRALILRDKRTQLVVWKTWFFRTCERRTVHCYNNAILLRCFNAWHHHLRRVRKLDQVAESKRIDDLLSSAWDNWRVSYSVREDARQQAAQHDTKKLLSGSFSAWKLAFGLARRHDQVQSSVEDRLLRQSMTRWVSALSAEQSLCEVANIQRLRSLFHAWKLESMACNLEHKFLQISAKSFFQRWRRESRANTFYYCSEDQRLVTTLRQWHSRTIIIQDHLLNAEDDMLAVSNARVATLSLRRWQSALERLRSQGIAGDKHYAHTIASFVFVRLRHLGDDLRFQRSRAAAFELKTSNKAAFYKWQASLANRQERNREAKLSILLNRRDEGLMNTVMARWRQRTLLYSQAATVAEELRSTRDANQMRYFFTAWMDRNLDIFEMERVARDRDREHSSAFLLDMLLTKFRVRSENVQLADQIWTQKVQNSGWLHLTRWHDKFRKLQEKNRHADFLWHDTFSKRNLRGVLRTWVSRRRDRVRSRVDETCVGEVSSSGSSFDASRTRTPWNDSRSLGFQTRSFLHG